MNTLLDYNETKKILEKYNQEHLLNFFEELTKTEQEDLLKQISEIDFEQLNNLYTSLVKKEQKSNDKIDTIEYIDKMKISENKRQELEQKGADLIKQNKLAAVTMAGGQGTRLGHNGPKGTFELFPGKSLFSILAESLKKACNKYQTTIEWYIMTSEENNDETISFFERNSYFQYKKQAVHFFKQGKLPLVNKNGKILLEEKGKIKLAADGNGSIFVSMLKNGIIEDMKKKNIEWMFIGSVDNCLLKMIDPIFLALTEEKKVLAATKSIVKANPKEKVGVFCRRNGKPSVVEYSEISEEMAEKKDENGELVFGESHIMCNMFNIKLIQQVGNEKLKYHVAFKKSDYINEEGKKVKAEEPNCYKFESFIFDMFERVDNILIMRTKREEEFAPVKNKEGVDSPETARQLYLNQNK